MSQAASTLEHGPVAVGLAPILIKAPGTRRSLLLQNLSNNDVYVGGPTVTTETGIKLSPGADITIYTLSAIYAIATAANSDVRYLEEA
jgi:hypothetical protein